MQNSGAKRLIYKIKLSKRSWQLNFFFYSRAVHLDIMKFFTPTDAQIFTPTDAQVFKREYKNLH